ncbi:MULTISPECIES: ATP-dependent nuclease [Enterobacterales]|uniref:ATP-dependent nuclease n=1 Tax=Enterobacterales TaxID=91347 RepID=UPI0020BFBF95|nr:MULTISPECIES: AAA family ATPase [Enterobacterales]ELM3739106.1 AAA family ATPase [Yersinia ruckeri]MCK8543781.1 AAA family ATPase [Yersinia ruckeri]MCK8553361.1 AAA family ATPase [Yersinia ruckeri]MCW6518873.1 AAA family ATPase [Yersinia ruckeri]MCW6550649.1 AAA family ATPase [Yersinia ruckeri]
MKINYVYLHQYRNFAEAHINLAKNSLVIGSNDVGKTNMIHALRLLLDKSLSEADIEPTARDFHCGQNGIQADYFMIRVAFSEVTQDAVLSQLKGLVSATGHFFLEFRATRANHSYEIAAGYDLSAMEVIPSRHYLKHLHLKYIHSQRDLVRYIRSEKRHLLRLAQESRDDAQVDADAIQLQTLTGLLESINSGVKNLHYVAEATRDLNDELQALSHHHMGYNVSLDTGAIGIEQFIEQLELGASTNGSRVMLGGDGRNNQILLALWKAKSVLEHDQDSEVVIYCVEEPEAHLHPHQQRKLASYLISALPGQTIVTTHSPQIAASYHPNSIIRLLRSNGASRAASQGCSDCINSAWTGLGYRISILPAEAFFSSAVMLVEGPSEMLFYAALARAHDYDLDHSNVSLLSVDGVAFEVYKRVLDALEIPWAVRTDNDISNILIGPRGAQEVHRNLAGMNRALSLAGMPPQLHRSQPYDHAASLADGTWQAVSTSVAPHGIFLSKIDLENDIAVELPALLNGFKGHELIQAIAYMQGKKAIRMQEFVEHCGPQLRVQINGHLLKPLLYCIQAAAQV